MIDCKPNAGVVGVHTSVLVRDASEQALIGEWQQWAREATPPENRAQAVEKLIDCLQANSKVLSLFNLGLISLPAHLPPCIEILQVCGNQLAQLPPLTGLPLKIMHASNNRLTTLPPSLPPSLKVLNVRNNELTSLANLPPALERLTIASNELTGLPELPAGLQYLDVSYNDLNVLPERLPAGLTDLYVNDNQLVSLPDLPLSLKKIDIRNNPFDLLPDYFSDSLIVVRDKPIESVIAGFTPNVQPWKSIGKEADVNYFIAFIKKLQAGAKNKDSSIFKERVGHWLDYLAREENKVLRANTFLMAREARTSCVDRASFYFNKMYLLMREDQLIKTDTPVVELFNTNLGLFRLQQLEKIAEQKAAARSVLSSGFAEEIEIYLAYECLLREELSLPIYSELQFSEIAGLTQDDLTRAKNEIEQQEKAGFIGYLMNESASWQARLTQWDRLQVESMEEAYLDFIGSDDFNQQVNEQLVKDKIDIHDADAQRNMSKTLAERLLYQQRYQLTREFLAAQGELALLDGFHLQYEPLDA